MCDFWGFNYIPEKHTCYMGVDSLSFVKLLENGKFDENVFVFTIGFKSLYTYIPVEVGVNLIKELIMIIPNAIFLTKLLNIILKIV